MDITKDSLFFNDLLTFSRSISNVLEEKVLSNKKKLFTCGIHVNKQTIKNNPKNKCPKCNSK
jgi:hypothetical protein